ncbi:SAYSvFN domain-containing protein 1 [Pectinophora gossypiella]|uniref:SAYSvFN domain-containing protein n=1 Tax=Pectinophora gossypiella TaxID=13191 RepID=A0A1E1WL57_PECGO|nr:SAYSvFN domain-containing protein 1 [Pectinophora gossypiella]
MEAKLREYRALRRRRELIDSAKEKLENTKQKIANILVPNIFTDMDKQKDDEVLLIEEPAPQQKPLIQFEEPLDIASEVSEVESSEEETQESWRYCLTKWTIYTVIWLTLYIFFLKVGFGAVFFASSVLIGIFLNTRTGKRKPGEVSAYSVFNQNCESIDGTLKAEELQRQMLYGVAGLRI